MPAGGAGRTAASPTEIPAKGWWAVVQRVWAEIGKDNMTIIAAGCAFYAMLALFPAITALVSIYGLVADPAAIEQHIGTLQGVLPQEAAKLIVDQMHSVASTTTGALGWSAALAILLALYSASSGVKTLFTALNVAYEEEEDRSFLRFNLTALVFTFLAIVSIIIGLGIIVGVPAVLAYLPLGPFAEWGVRIASWLVLLALVIVGLAMIYRFGPSRAPANWRWLTPGSITAAVLWLLASAAFSFYAAHFGSYNKTYGALAGVIILLMWLYISAFVILLGAELNAELELQTEKDTTTGRPEPMGERQAYVADHVVGGRTV
ncbi:YihY/virulence factor BrkB family protein [Benzoatithermus flavus]|uniref:YihY/virulence factor BrkB family protein n=1 Tax=Benzoatithermus flavus TaxID=3108223 RepID=A0ABU8XMV7_9PROT